MEILQQRPLDQEDRIRVEAVVAALTGEPRRHVRSFVADGVPQPKQRARRGKGRRWYTPDETTAAETYIGLHWRSVLKGEILRGSLAVAGLFFMPTHRVVDGDNLLKLCLDAANRAGVWRDDSQATAQGSIVEWDPKRPRTVIAFAPIRSSIIR